MLDYLRNMLVVQRTRWDERGASAVEYGLMIAGIAAVLIVVIFSFGGMVLHGLFENTCNTVGTSAGKTCS